VAISQRVCPTCAQPMYLEGSHPSPAFAHVHCYIFSCSNCGAVAHRAIAVPVLGPEVGPSAPYFELMKDIYDGAPWTEMDIRDLTAVLETGSTIEDAAQHLCRSGTVDEVRRKAEELGLIAKTHSTP
jgi:hypothetical protein